MRAFAGSLRVALLKVQPFYFADQSTTNDPVLAEEPCLG